MGKNNYDRFLTVLLAILVVIVLTGLGYLIYKYYETYKINSKSENYLDNDYEKYLNEIGKYTNDLNENTNNIEDENNTVPDQNEVSGYRGINIEAPKYGDYKVEGKLEMPSVNLRYPVLELCTDANELDVSIAIQYGVGLNKVGNTVIAGHNYRSGLFFGSNKKMNIGDSLFITDSETGKRIEYKIYDKFSTEESDTTYFNRNTNGKREVSLVTCQSNNKYRLVILAREV